MRALATKGSASARGAAAGALAPSPASAVATPTVTEAISGAGAPPDASVRERMERVTGHDFGSVRVHTDERAARGADAVGALAFTYGTHIAFARSRYAPHDREGAHLLAHELAHVAQQSEAREPRIQRQVGPRPQPAAPSPCAASPVRASPPGGVAIQNGQLAWTLTCVGDPPASSQMVGNAATFGPRGRDIAITATFTPTTANACSTFTFIQTIRGDVGGIQDHPHLVFTRDAASGASVDAFARDTEPFYGAGPRAGGGLGDEIAGNPPHPGAGSGAIQFDDAPRVLTQGRTAVRSFEVAVVCAESGRAMGSLRYGYTKHPDGTIDLSGGQAADVSATGASAAFEPVRQAFYAGYFQHSLGGFARGSATLTPGHRATLRAIPALASAAAIQGIEGIVLVGANDHSGGPEADASLSLRRAEAVRRFLVDVLHVPSTLIRVEGHGVEARVPNPQGVQVAANRRVDVRLERGRTLAATAPDVLRIRAQNPRTTFTELTERLLELRTHRTIRRDEWTDVQTLLDALRVWRARDPTVPDPEVELRGALDELRRRIERPEANPYDTIGPLPLMSDPDPPDVRQLIEGPLRRPPF